MALYLGIDVGGTSIKGLLMNEKSEVLSEGSVPTKSGELLDSSIEELIEQLILAAGAYLSDVKSVGIGCPGIIDSTTGTVIFAGNLGISNYPLGKLVREKIGIDVKVGNDANVAALGEAKFGAAKGYSSSVLVTLGTGIGGGIILDGKIFEGNKGAGAEIGHMVIDRGGEKCTCGRRGCFEVYCSARALTKKVKAAMEDDTASDMWKTYTYETADARTAFEYMDVDGTAKNVINWYFKHLTCGLANIANIFRPEVIMIGGGVANQGTRISQPIQAALNEELFGGISYAPVLVTCAKLGSKAGAYGAVALAMEE